MCSPPAVGVLLALTLPAHAQLAPARAYYGINRSIPMTVRIPADAQGDAVVQLLAPVSAESRAAASVVAGGVDLAGLFPMLWRPASAPTPQSLVYAQLVIGGKKVGPAVVLQPILEPLYAGTVDQTGQPVFLRPRPGPDGKPPPPTYSGLRAYIDQDIVMETSLGEIQFRMRPDQAPNTVWNFLSLCRAGFYTDVEFHRIVAINPATHAPFVVQAGDPIRGHEAGLAAHGEGGPGYMIDLERSGLPHDFGVISMARDRDQPNSAGSQFFIGLSREGTAFLDGTFCSFGQAVSGAEVIQKIAAVPVDSHDHPIDPPVIKSCRLVDAPPYGDGPVPVQRPPTPPVQR